MPRRARHTPGGFVYHVLNRGVGRRTRLYKPDDYAAFERILAQAHQDIRLRILAYCLMPNLRRSVQRGCPFGDEDWQREVAAELELEFTLGARGRPPKTNPNPEQ